MPYKKVGKSVFKKEDGKMKKVGSSKSKEMAAHYLNTLRAIEHGWKPTQKSAKKMVWHAKRSK